MISAGAIIANTATTFVRTLAAATVRQRRAPGRRLGNGSKKRPARNAFIYSVSSATHRRRFPSRGDRVVMLLLRHRNGEFGPPGGRVDEDENSWQAAKRESREETGYIFNSVYHEILKFDYGTARIYLHSVRELPPSGPPGPLRSGREIDRLQHFTLPELRLMVRGSMSAARIRPAGQEALTRVVAELEACGYV